MARLKRFNSGRECRSAAAGFTLIEVLVSLSIISVVAAGVVPALHIHLRHNYAMEIRSGAIQAAQLVLDDLRFADPATLPSSGSDSPRSVMAGDHGYQVVVSYCLESSYCNSSMRHVALEVSFRNKVVYVVETVFTKLR